MAILCNYKILVRDDGFLQPIENWANSHVTPPALFTDAYEWSREHPKTALAAGAAVVGLGVAARRIGFSKLMPGAGAALETLCIEGRSLASRLGSSLESRTFSGLRLAEAGGLSLDGLSFAGRRTAGSVATLGEGNLFSIAAGLGAAGERQALSTAAGLGAAGERQALSTVAGLGAAGENRAFASGAASIKSAETGRALPEFTALGYLPPGEHFPTWRQFAERYCTNPHRALQLSRLEPRLIALGESGASEVAIGGSFLTHKPNPGDIDAAFERDGMNWTLLRKLDPALATEVPKLQQKVYPSVAFFSRDLPFSEASRAREFAGCKAFFRRSKASFLDVDAPRHDIGIVVFRNESLPRVPQIADLIGKHSSTDPALAAALSGDAVSIPIRQKECARLLANLPVRMNKWEWLDLTTAAGRIKF